MTVGQFWLMMGLFALALVLVFIGTEMNHRRRHRAIRLEYTKQIRLAWNQAWELGFREGRDGRADEVSRLLADLERLRQLNREIQLR